jgi:hypothetical protein
MGYRYNMMRCRRTDNLPMDHESYTLVYTFEECFHLSFLNTCSTSVSAIDLPFIEKEEEKDAAIKVVGLVAF